jgi:hypothetical protein
VWRIAANRIELTLLEQLEAVALGDLANKEVVGRCNNGVVFEHLRQERPGCDAYFSKVSQTELAARLKAGCEVDGR